MLQTVYVIKSNLKNWYYVGMTSDLEKRIKQHNNRQSRATKAYAPFTLIFTKEFSDRISTRDYEIFLKVRSNKEKLIKSLSLYNRPGGEMVDARVSKTRDLKNHVGPTPTPGTSNLTSKNRRVPQTAG